MATSVSDSRIVVDGPTGAGLAARDDRTLVLDFQAGRPEAYEEIDRRYRGLARHICLRMLRNAEDADEAVQETMLRVYQGLPRFNGRYLLHSWVARVATNVSLDMLRARNRRPQNGEPLHELVDDRARDSDTDPGDVVERILEMDRVRATLADLPEHHREALVLREFEGRSHREIGDALGVSPSQAKALLHRARLSFRRVWAGENGKREKHEGRGVAALIPAFLLPHRLFGFLRRAADRAGEAGQAAASSPALTAVASSPTLATASTPVADRVVAATVTLLVAGSVGLGAVAVTRHRDEAKPKTAVVAPSPVTEGKAAPADPIAGDRKVKGQGLALGPPVTVPAPGDGTEPATSPSAVPPADTPSPPPSDPSPPPPSDSPPPTPPAWAFTFTPPAVLLKGCGACTFDARLVDSRITGNAAETLGFRQVIDGRAVDPEGGVPWKLYMEYQGETTIAWGSATFTFYLDTADGGHYAYQAETQLAEAKVLEDGSTSFTFHGPYALLGDAPGQAPKSGELTATFVFWTDGTSWSSSEITLS